MKAATVKQLKDELNQRSTKELLELCLRLSKFKKENKELLTYILFEESDEMQFIKEIQEEVDQDFEAINTARYFFIKKSIRKILRNIKKYIRYSKKKQTEAELLLYFCRKLKNFKPSIRRNTQLMNMYNQQLKMAKNAIAKLHEDLQYDYSIEVEELEN